MHLGVASAADAEIRDTIGAALLQLPHQVNGIAVGPIRAIRALHIRRNVSPQSHDVLDACGLHVGNTGTDGLPCGGYAGQVSQGRHTVSLLDGLGHLQRILTGTASRAVGHAEIRGRQIRDLLDGGLDGCKGGIGLRGKDLKGNGQPLAGKQMRNLHGKYLLSGISDFLPPLYHESPQQSRGLEGFLTSLFKFGFVGQGHHPCTPPETLLQKGFWTSQNL